MLNYSEIFNIIDKYNLQFIPIIPKQKEPLIPWKIYQTEKINVNKFKTQYFRENNNIAILGGTISNNLFIVDIDDYTFASIIKKYIPETFITRTTKGLHFYFFGTETVNKKRIEFFRNEELSFGIDIQGEGAYVLAPPSIHPSGKAYEIFNNTDITYYNYSIIEDILLEKATKLGFKPKEVIKKKRTITYNNNTLNSYWLAIESLLPNLENMIGFSGQGPHPIHGSEGGHNLIVSDNVWHCFRHETSGGKLQWFAIQEGIVDCSNANTITPNQWVEITNKIKEMYINHV